MKKNTVTALWRIILLVGLWLPNSTYLLAQSTPISGTVKGAKNEVMPGVTVVLKGANKGTTTDQNGTYSLEAPVGSTLVFSFIGYQTQEVAINGKTTISVTMSETSASLDEVVVTGVFDKRTALESSIAISTLNSRAISRLAANSAADLLSYTPGVYVNSSVGEINNTVYSRGVNANQFGASGGNGYYYVALMEDGLPASNISSGNIVADYFYRADATLSRLESVRGGSASITGNNSPGGIFNYVSNTGQKPVNEVGYKFGLEGNGRNVFNRLDANLGGKLGSSGWFYNVGGFYRASEGPRNPGYLLNKGGQIKANLIKPLANGGYWKVYAKYLNDRNALPQALPAQNYDNPGIAAGFTNYDSYMLPKGASVQPLWGTSNTYTFDPAKLAHSTDISLGTELSLNLKNGWTLNNNIKYSHKTVEQDLTILSTPTSLTSLLTYALMGFVTPGNISLNDRATGQQLAEINADFSRGPSWAVTRNNLPNQQIMANGVLFNFTSYSQSKVDEVIEQISLNKKAGKHSLTFGSYLAFSHLATDPNGTANTSLRPIENKASPLDITLTLPGGGPKLQVTNPLGYAGLSGGRFSFTANDINQNQIAFYVADGIQATDRLTIDLGVRYDNIGVNGSNTVGIENPAADKGGVDNNPLTLYDNYYFVKGPVIPYRSSLNLISYSAGVNYRLNNSSSVYTRFSSGQKAPDLQFYFDNYRDQTAIPQAKAQTVTQVEVGYKIKTATVSGALIPFYSRLSNVPVSTVGQDTDGTSYFTPIVFNTLSTFGLEAEANVNLSAKFSINANATVQKATATVWQAWVIGNNGKADDQLVNYNGNTGENVPALMLNISPVYSVGKGYAMLTYKYLGARQANIANVFTLPGFGQFNLSAGYTISPKISLTANINNLANTVGVMNWQPSTQFSLVDAFGHDSFTVEKRNAAPNSIFQIIPIQPRAYFLTVKYRF
ncbi:TonB-dependent receptor [Spirosoma areae]